MMKVGRKVFFARAPYNRPGIFAGPIWHLPVSYYELLVINFRFVVLNVFETLRKKIKSYDNIFKCHPGSTGSFTSFPGGNQVDGLPPASSNQYRNAAAGRKQSTEKTPPRADRPGHMRGKRCQ